MKNPTPIAWSLVVSAVPLLCLALGCAKVTETGNPTPGGSGGAGAPNVRDGGIAPPPPGMCIGKCNDLPAEPIMDMGVPANAADMFPGSPPTTGGPCVVEPQDDTLFPNNWLRPRVRFTGAGGKLVKITMTADNQNNTLTAYTMSDTWIMPKAIWGGLRFHQITDSVKVNVWVQGGGASEVRFRTAPVGAPGNLVFWAANPALVDIDPHMCRPPAGSIDRCAAGAQLRGFAVGDETTISVLQIPQVTQMSKTDSGNASPVICIGCHTGMPDSGYVTFIDHYPWRAVTASVQAAPMTGAYLPSQTPGGLAALQLPGWGPFTYNKSAWAPGMKIGIAGLGLATPTTIDYSNNPDRNKMPNLAWINLESPNPGQTMGNWIVPSYAPGAGITSGNAVGIITRTGDTGGAVFPNWSHNGQTVVYASTIGALSSRLDVGKTDLYTVPFNNGMGGQVTPVVGAATPEAEEYYPAYSPDDRLIAFTRVPAGQVMYSNPNAEIAVVPAAGGMASRLRANDPPECSGKRSPGINNHWPKWSPEAISGHYWLVFSSNRGDIPPVRSQYGTMRTIPVSQLYVAPIIMQENGVPQSFPAIYLWNQPADAVNTTPAWETFTFPPIP